MAPDLPPLHGERDHRLAGRRRAGSSDRGLPAHAAPSRPALPVRGADHLRPRQLGLHVAIIAYVYAQTHSAAWVGAIALGRFIPSLLVSSYAGVVAERFARVRVLVTADLLCTAYMVAMAATMAVEGPSLLAIVLAALTSTPSTVTALNALTFLASAALISRMRARSRPTDVREDGGPLRQMLVGVRAIGWSSTAALPSASACWPASSTAPTPCCSWC
jgi:hypothetical protein